MNETITYMSYIVSILVSKYAASTINASDAMISITWNLITSTGKTILNRINNS